MLLQILSLLLFQFTFSQSPPVFTTKWLASIDKQIEKRFKLEDKRFDAKTLNYSLVSDLVKLREKICLDHRKECLDFSQLKQTLCLPQRAHMQDDLE